MTVRNNIDARALERRLAHIERCAEEAPAGTYQEARVAAELIHQISTRLLLAARAAGFMPPNDDRLREVEAVIYGYLAAGDCAGLVVGEGFGEHVDGPAGERVKAQATRDRDQLVHLGVIAAPDISDAVREERLARARAI